jgi:hypothetical protein
MDGWMDGWTGRQNLRTEFVSFHESMSDYYVFKFTFSTKKFVAFKVMGRRLQMVMR